MLIGSRQSLADDVRIEGPIPFVLERTRMQIEAWQPTRRALSRTGTFEDVGLVPQDAWWEGVVNAAVHRSYSMAGDHIHVDIFDDRIEIASPGRFPGLVDFEHPEHMTRFARNPRIARVCADLRIGQELGEGIRRMFDEMRAAGLTDPLYVQTSGSVGLTLSGEPVHRELEARLPGATRAIVQALREAERLSTGELAELIDVTRPTMLRYLHSLRDAELVEWVGKSERDPRAYWRLR
jgi:ATP-dependent DNA helicase RecG